MLSPNLRGIVFMVIGMTTITTNDAIFKIISEGLPLSLIIFLRGLLATAILAFYIFIIKGYSLPSLQLKTPIIWLRGLLEVFAAFTFLTGLKYLPIANVAALISVVPLSVTLAGALFLKEPIGWRRMLAIIFGMLGVLIIVRPGFSAFNVYSLYILACVVIVTARDLVTRKAASEVSSFSFTISTTFAVMLSGLFMTAASTEFMIPSPYEMTLLGLAASLLAVANFFIVQAMRQGDVAVVTPFRYSALVWAIILGSVLFNEIPDEYSILGSVMIVTSGLYIIWRERLNKQNN